MNKALKDKIAHAIQKIRAIWPKLDGKRPFIAFSTGKDSLALAAIAYEALAPVRPVCLYAHHDMEFPTNLDYLEQIRAHGFVHWRRIKAQDVVGAIKRRLRNGVIAYTIRDRSWIQEKHLDPVRGNWAIYGREVRFWSISERVSDLIIKRMMNCLDCGFCMVECFPCKRFDRQEKTLVVDGCIRCGHCLQLKFCMGWQHRFWRRIIVEKA